MATLEVTLAEDVEATTEYGAPTCRVDGLVSAKALAPGDWPLFGVRAALAPGATLTWDGTHGDEAIYVVSGALEVDGNQCPPEGSLVLEAGIPAKATAVGETEIVHFGPRDTTPPQHGRNGPSKPGESVHVFGPGGVWASRDDVRDTRMYADSTCPTCRATIFYTARKEEYLSAGHSHSQDELIHVIWGGINVGRRHIGPGDTIAIPADLRYGFRSDPGGFGFLNYRPDASVQSFERGGEPRIEGGEANGMQHVNDVIA